MYELPSCSESCTMLGTTLKLMSVPKMLPDTPRTAVPEKLIVNGSGLLVESAALPPDTPTYRPPEAAADQFTPEMLPESGLP